MKGHFRMEKIAIAAIVLTLASLCMATGCAANRGGDGKVAKTPTPKPAVVAASAPVEAPVSPETAPPLQPSAESPMRLVSDHAARPAAPKPQAAPQGVVHGSRATFDQQVLRSEVPVLVDFYADWCGPCKRLAPALEELAAETSQAKVVKINIDQNPELADRYGVRSIPTLIVFKEGKAVNTQKGLVTKERMKTMLDL